MLKNTMKKTMRMIFLVISLMVLWLSNCLAYKVENGRVLYDLYDISVMTVTNGSEKYNHFYWCSGTDLAKKGKNAMFQIYNPDQHPGEWIQMFPFNDEVVGITSNKEIVDQMVKSVEYARYHQLEDCTWRIGVIPSVYFILRNESNGKIAEFDRSFITDSKNIKNLSAKYSELVSNKGEGYHVELKPYYFVVVMKYNQYSKIKFASDFAEGRIPVDMYVKDILGIDVTADYHHEMYNQTHPWNASEGWKKDYWKRQMDQVLFELREQYEKYGIYW